MAHILHKGAPVETVGTLPQIGSKAPDFLLTKTDLTDVSLRDFGGKIKVLSINPSLDTGTCAMSARKFNDQVAGKADVVVLNVSADLPFAARRFCEANNIGNVITLSQMRNQKFGTDYGVLLKSGPLAGILSRAVVVVGKDDVVLYTEQVPETSKEPDYDAVWKAIS
ncbi:MAG: thiol peroxidase [Spirochaetales bacterium]